MNTYPTTLSITEGNIVTVNGKLGTVVQIIDTNTVSISDYDTGEVAHYQVSDIKPQSHKPIHTPLIETLDEKRLHKTKEKYDAIAPLLFKPNRTSESVEALAEKVGVHRTTIYKWIRLYESSKALTSLAPSKRSDVGKSRLPVEIEEIISQTIKTEYLTKQKKSPAKIYQQIKGLCIKRGLIPPSASTVNRRIRAIPEFKRIAKREGRRAAEEKLSQIRGRFPGAEEPLAIVQIDHTELNIILVDDVDREHIGRLWITLAMDVYSRMVTGYYLSLDPPGYHSVGQCLAQSILPKEDWLTRHDLNNEWPCYGTPQSIHADNATEFRGDNLIDTCKQYNMNLIWRPVARPEYGAHVERLLGTFKEEILTLPGTTFSNIKERGSYNSEKKATFTFKEFERWLATFINDYYHVKYHSDICMSPLEKYKQGILGDSKRPGIGIPPRILDVDKFKLDFLPRETRTVQRYGIKLDNITYWHDVLKPWVASKDPDNPKLNRSFIIRRDPRDISKIWFFDPELQRYYPIPYRDTSHPPVSIWEVRKAKRKLREDGKKGIDEDQLFLTLDRLRAMEEEATGKSKKARRAKQRRALSTGIDKPPKGNIPKEIKQVENDLSYGEIKPFDELEEL